MHAYVVPKYKSKLVAAELPEPVVGDNDVLIDVRAASVNPIDGKLRDGEFRPLLPYRAPFTLGHDLAGTITAVGSRVTRFSVGDEVFGRVRDGRIGTFAERISAHEDDLAHKPKTLTMAEAASVPLVALTAWQALVDRANVQPGQRVLIHAGSGGVGTWAIQLAKHLGATVATTTSAANADWVAKLGADTVIDYRTQNFTELLRDFDVVLDGQGPASVNRSLSILGPGGIAIGLGGPPDPDFARTLGRPLLFVPLMTALSRKTRRLARRRGARYSFLFMSPSGSQLTEIAKLIDAGSLRPIVERTYPFAQTIEAVEHVDSGRAKGKIVIER